MLLALQIGHSGILLLSLAAIAHLWRIGLRDVESRAAWPAMLWLAGVGLSILANGGVCPLQTLARRIAGTDGPVRDMLTPDWLNAQVVPVLTPVALGGILLVLWRMRRRAGARRGA